MFSKEEAQKLREEFWIGFAEVYPRRWILHKTKIKDVTFKFYADVKVAKVMLDIASKEVSKRKIYYEKIQSLRSFALEEYLNDVQFEENCRLETGKEISRIWVELTGVSIHNRKTWQSIYDFFYEKMDKFELFFLEYEDYIKDLELNT